MSSYKTKHSIGDLVYTANEYGFDRDVIKAIKIVGLSENIKYGIKEKSSGFYGLSFFGNGDGYSWYKSNEIFETREEAESYSNALIAKKEAKEAEKKLKERKERLEKLEKEKKALESGEDYNPYEDD